MAHLRGWTRASGGLNQVQRPRAATLTSGSVRDLLLAICEHSALPPKFHACTSNVTPNWSPARRDSSPVFRPHPPYPEEISRPSPEGRRSMSPLSEGGHKSGFKLFSSFA